MNPARRSAAETPRHEYPWVPMWVMLLLCIYIVSWYLQIGVRRPMLGAIRFEFWLGALLVVLVFYRVSGGMGKGQRNQPLVGWTVALCVILGVYVVFSANPSNSWFIFSERVIKFAFIAGFVATFVKSPRNLRWFLGAMFFAWLKLGQEGLVGNITGGLIWQNQGIMRLHGSTGIIAHPNSFAGWALGTLPFVYFLYPVMRQRLFRALLLLQALLSFHVLIYTGSRTGYVGLAGLALFIVWHSPRKARAFTVIALMVVIAAFTVPESYIERATSIVTLEEAQGNSSGTRIQILEDAWEILMDNPLGVGVSAFPTVRMWRFGRAQDTHNLYLQVATNIGFHGLIIFGMFVFTLLRSLGNTQRYASNLLQRIRDRGESERDQARTDDVALVAATARAVEGFIVIRLVLGLFGMDLYELYWWLALGFALSLRNMLYHAERIDEEISPEPI